MLPQVGSGLANLVEIRGTGEALVASSVTSIVVLVPVSLMLSVHILYQGAPPTTKSIALYLALVILPMIVTKGSSTRSSL